MASRVMVPKDQRPKLPQQEWDEAVTTNIEDFDMAPEEAVEAAKKEFEMQGYDLSTVIMSAAGGDVTAHPVAAATRGVEEAGSPPFERLGEQLDALASSISKHEDNPQELYAVCLKARTLPALLTVAKAVSAAQPFGAEQRAQLLRALALARALCQGSLEVRDTMDDDGIDGAEAALVVLDAHAPGDVGIMAAAAALAEAACFKEEQNKERFMETGFILRLLKLLPDVTSADAASASNAAAAADRLAFIQGACGALRSVVTADDERPPSSKAFMNARLLARTHSALKVLLAVLKQAGFGSSDAAASLLAAVRQLAANDEICKDFSDDGGLLTILDVMRAWSSLKEVMRCGCGALRQLANSDLVKKMLAEHGAIEVMLQVVSMGESCPGSTGDDLIEPALGTLVNMMLRLPEVVTKAAEAGVIDVAVEILQTRAASAPVMRQSCMLVRNMVVRNPELRPQFLDKGTEALLRAAKRAHAKQCGDVGSAALRDLGLDNYNE